MGSTCLIETDFVGEGIVPIHEFREKQPDIELLKAIFPGLEEYLKGEFSDEAKVYEQFNGVTSWALSSGPTLGMMPLGEYSFPTGDNIETCIILDGKVKTSLPIKKENGLYQIIAKDVLELKIMGRPLTYFCLYEPKPKE